MLQSWAIFLRRMTSVTHVALSPPGSSYSSAAWKCWHIAHCPQAPGLAGLRVWYKVRVMRTCAGKSDNSEISIAVWDLAKRWFRKKMTGVEVVLRCITPGVIPKIDKRRKRRRRRRRSKRRMVVAKRRRFCSDSRLPINSSSLYPLLYRNTHRCSRPPDILTLTWTLYNQQTLFGEMIDLIEWSAHGATTMPNFL